MHKNKIVKAAVALVCICALALNIGILPGLFTSAADENKYSKDLPISGDEWKNYVVSADNVGVYEQNRGWDRTERYFISPTAPHSSGSIVFKFDAGEGKVFGTLKLLVKYKTEGTGSTDTQFKAYVSTDNATWTQFIDSTHEGKKEPTTNLSGEAAGASGVYVKFVMYTTNFRDWTDLMWLKLDGTLADASEVKTYEPTNVTNTGVFFANESQYKSNMIESYNLNIKTINAGWGPDSSHAMWAGGDDRAAYAVFKFDAGEGKVWNALRAEWKAPCHWDQSFCKVYASTDGKGWALIDTASNNNDSGSGIMEMLTGIAAGNRYLYIKLAVFQQATGGRADITMFSLCKLDGNYTDMTRDAQPVTTNTPDTTTAPMDINAPGSDHTKGLIEYAGVGFTTEGTYNTVHPAGLRAYGYATYRFDAPEGKVFQRLKLHTQIRCADPGSADILVSTDKEHWVYLRKFSNNGHDLNAHYYDDMTGYAAGKSTVYVRFVMVSRDNNADDAWVRYINVDAYEANVRFRDTVAPIEGDLTVTGPDKTAYAGGAELDLTGLTVTDKNGNAVKYYAVDDRPATKSANVLKDEAGTYTIPVTYLDGNGVHTGSFTVRVMESAGELAVTAEPTNKAVVKGGTPDYTGLKVTYTDKDGVARELNADEYTVVAPDTSSVGDKTVTVQYTVGEVTLEATFTITVVSNVATDLELTLPNVLDYTVGENFSADGLKVTAVYEGGRKVELSLASEGVEGYTITGVDRFRTGAQTVTVAYSGIEKTFTVNYQGPTYVDKTAADTSLPWDMANADPAKKLWESHMVGTTGNWKAEYAPQGEGWGENIRWRLQPSEMNTLSGMIFKFESEETVEQFSLTYKGPTYGRMYLWLSADKESWTLAHSITGAAQENFEGDQVVDLSAAAAALNTKTVYVKLELVATHETRTDLAAVSCMKFALNKGGDADKPIVKEPQLNFELKKDIDPAGEGGSLPFVTNFGTEGDVMPYVWEATDVVSYLTEPGWGQDIQNYLRPTAVGKAEYVTFRFDAPEGCTFGNAIAKFKGLAYGKGTVKFYASSDNETWGEPVFTLTGDKGGEFDSERSFLFGDKAKDWQTMYVKIEMTAVQDNYLSRLSWLSVGASFAKLGESDGEILDGSFLTRFKDADYLDYVIENDGLMSGAFYDVTALTPPTVNDTYHITFKFKADEGQKFATTRLSYSGRAISSGRLLIEVSTDGGRTWTKVNELKTSRIDEIPADGPGDFNSARTFNITNSVKGTDNFLVRATLTSKVETSRTALTFLKINADYEDNGEDPIDPIDPIDPEDPTDPTDPDDGKSDDTPKTGIAFPAAAALIAGASAAAVLISKKRKHA